MSNPSFSIDALPYIESAQGQVNSLKLLLLLLLTFFFFKDLKHWFKESLVVSWEM